jgi:hypothetical protein
VWQIILDLSIVQTEPQNMVVTSTYVSVFAYDVLKNFLAVLNSCLYLCSGMSRMQYLIYLS